MNTEPFSLLTISPFDELHSFDALTYDHITPERLLSCSLHRDDRVLPARVELLIRKEEAHMWQACSSMVQFQIGQMKERLRGSFTFDLICLDMYGGIDNIDWSHMHTLISNRGRTMRPGEESVVKYRSLYGLLKKHTPLEWGKIAFSHCVHTHAKEDAKIDLLIKKRIRQDPGSLYVIRDISRRPVIDRDNADQMHRLRKLFAGYDAAREPFPDIVYVHPDLTVESLSSWLGSHVSD